MTTQFERDYEANIFRTYAVPLKGVRTWRSWFCSFRNTPWAKYDRGRRNNGLLFLIFILLICFCFGSWFFLPDPALTGFHDASKNLFLPRRQVMPGEKDRYDPKYQIDPPKFEANEKTADEPWHQRHLFEEMDGSDDVEIRDPKLAVLRQQETAKAKLKASLQPVSDEISSQRQSFVKQVGFNFALFLSWKTLSIDNLIPHR